MRDAHMTSRVIWLLTTLSTALIATAWGDTTAAPGVETHHDSLVGAWRSQIRFSTGPLAEVKNLEFMYVYNVGGTMTESSNYDGAPPVPPAYGVWRKTGEHRFETKYTFFMTKSPATFDEIAKGGGWLPSGHGVLTEQITLAEDGNTYTSTVSITAFDSAGKPLEFGGEGTGTATRMDF
jgi:hypothetical protein